MSKIKNVNYESCRFVMRNKTNYIIKRLLKDGNKLRKEDSYNHKLGII